MRGLCLALAVLCASTARGEELDAKGHYERGLAAFALGNYQIAADEYEKAFAIKPDPALLYNAAQAHRLAGNKARALQLYTNYLSIFGKKQPNSTEVLRHIAALKLAIDSERKAQNQPPIEPAPVTPDPVKKPQVAVVAPPPPKPAPKPPEPTPEPISLAPTPSVEPTPAKAPEPVATPAPVEKPVEQAPQERKPIYKKAWFWGVIAGAVVVVGVGVGLGVGLSSGPSDPVPSFGTVTLR
jgi:tetratricopeptide (TPR) repeat protein